MRDYYLSDEVKRIGSRGVCTYCHQRRNAVSIDYLADRIETAFEDHYEWTSSEPEDWQRSLLADRELDYDFVREGESTVSAIEGAAQIPWQAAEDVQTILEERHENFDSAAMGEECEFGSTVHYQRQGPNALSWNLGWQSFEHSLKTEARFFNSAAAAQLSKVFSKIGDLGTIDEDPLIVLGGRQVVLNHLFRARVFQSDAPLKLALCRPDVHLGPPPARLASAGRMNARGISVFYGATDSRTAIAEVRPPVGSKVLVARFRLDRHLLLLDLTALEKVHDEGSVFDPTLKDRLGKAAFLQTLGQRMSKAVMPDDQDLDYLPTQAVADYLATLSDPHFDGIIFASAQIQGGKNVVLFHKAARVEAMEVPKGTVVSAAIETMTADGLEPDYFVSEEPPSEDSSAAPDDVLHGDRDSLLRPAAFSVRGWEDPRDVTLVLDADSVVVHVIDQADYSTSDFPVRRHRFDKRHLKF